MKTVFLIEDEGMVVRSLKRFIVADKVQITVAMTHKDAQQIIEDCIASGLRFDLILVDGELDGRHMSYDLIRTMAEHRLGDQIVAISGLWSQEQMKAGCTSAHPKGGDLNPFLQEFFEI